MKGDEMHIIGDFIVDTLKNAGDESRIKRTRERVQEFCAQFPLFQDPE
jgi:glycine/serine hydroxymethyltransferase